MTITTTGQRARIERTIIAGQPRHVDHVDVVSIEGDVLTYTVDGVWFSTATRSDGVSWQLLPLIEKIGHTAPDGLPAYGGGVFHFSPDYDDDGQPFDDYGMEYNIHETPAGVFLAACHSAVGLVTWFSAASVDDVWKAIEDGEREQLARAAGGDAL